MVKKRENKKPEEQKQQGVAGSKGLPSSSRGNPPAHGDDKASKEKGKSNEGKGVKKGEAAAETSMGLADSSLKKGPVLDQSKDPEIDTDDHDSGLSSDDHEKLEPVYAFDASGELVHVGDRKILSKTSAEFQKKSPRHNYDDPNVYSGGDEFDAQEQRETLQEKLGPQLIKPNGDESPAPEPSDLKEKGSSSFRDPHEEDSRKGVEGTVLSTKKNKKNKEEEKKETVLMPEKERKEANEIKCVLCQSPSENMHRASKCGHHFCSSCMKDYIWNNQKQEKDILVGVLCPEDCPGTLSDEEIFAFLGDKDGFNWLMGKNCVSLKQLRVEYRNLKNAAGSFMRMLYDIA